MEYIYIWGVRCRVKKSGFLYLRQDTLQSDVYHYRKIIQSNLIGMDANEGGRVSGLLKTYNEYEPGGWPVATDAMVARFLI